MGNTIFVLVYLTNQNIQKQKKQNASYRHSHPQQSLYTAQAQQKPAQHKPTQHKPAQHKPTQHKPTQQAKYDSYFSFSNPFFKKHQNHTYSLIPT